MGNHGGGNGGNYGRGGGGGAVTKEGGAGGDYYGEGLQQRVSNFVCLRLGIHLYILRLALIYLLTPVPDLRYQKLLSLVLCDPKSHPGVVALLHFFKMPTSSCL